MSIALSASIRAADPKRNQLPRQVFPVGARFPRRTNETKSASMNSAAAVPAAHVPVFPVGARFPRRSDIDVAIYLTLLSGSEDVTANGRAYPVGARFPRRRD
jgi:hypothetical protein